MSSFGLIKENIELSRIHLPVRSYYLLVIVLNNTYLPMRAQQS